MTSQNSILFESSQAFNVVKQNQQQQWNRINTFYPRQRGLLYLNVWIFILMPSWTGTCGRSGSDRTWVWVAVFLVWTYFPANFGSLGKPKLVEKYYLYNTLLTVTNKITFIADWVTSPCEEDPRVSQLSCASEAGKSQKWRHLIVDGAAKWKTRRSRPSILLTHPWLFSILKSTNATDGQINGQTHNN